MYSILKIIEKFYSIRQSIHESQAQVHTVVHTYAKWIFVSSS